MRRTRILIVDDEPDMTLLVKACLERRGEFVVREENLASRALSAARQFRPDLILLDVMMPTLDGADVASLLESDPLLRDTPVIFLTATVLAEEVEANSGMIGGRAFIAKPVDVGDLLDRIRAALGCASGV